MTDDKSKSKPHEFRESFYTYDASGGAGSVPVRAWVPEAEAQEKIAELENTVRLRGARLDAYVEEIERLREVVKEYAQARDAAQVAACRYAREADTARAEAARLRQARDMNAAERDTARAELRRRLAQELERIARLERDGAREYARQILRDALTWNAARIELDSAKAQAKASEAAAAEAIRTRDACLSRERDTVARTTDHDREIQDLRAALESTRIEAARQAHRAKVWRAAALAG